MRQTDFFNIIQAMTETAPNTSGLNYDTLFETLADLQQNIQHLSSQALDLQGKAKSQHIPLGITTTSK